MPEDVMDHLTEINHGIGFGNNSCKPMRGKIGHDWIGGISAGNECLDLGIHLS